MTTPTQLEGDALRAAGAHAAPAQPSGIVTVAQLSRWGRIHADVNGFGHALLHMAPVLERIATNPLIDQLVEAALQAEGLGVEAQAFHAAIDALTGASRRAQGSGPQPSQPAPGGNGAM